MRVGEFSLMVDTVLTHGLLRYRVNTAVVITIITPFTASLTSGALVNQIYALYFAEILTTNALQLLDIVGNIKRHFLAPRAATQDSMNLNFSGTDFELAERYTK